MIITLIQLDILSRYLTKVHFTLLRKWGVGSVQNYEQKVEAKEVLI